MTWLDRLREWEQKRAITKGLNQHYGVNVEHVRALLDAVEIVEALAASDPIVAFENEDDCGLCGAEPTFDVHGDPHVRHADLCPWMRAVRWRGDSGSTP